MSRSGIEELLYAMDQAFEGQGESLLTNLASVPGELWTWVPPGGKRTVFAIVSHVAEARYVYDNHAFRDQSMRFDRPETMPSLSEGASPEEAIGWLRDGHRLLRESVAALADDGELRKERYGWSLRMPLETRSIINVMIQHDSYHAGEINHIRALAQGND